jgi:hypothetical protein
MGQVGGFAFAAFQNGVGMGRIAQVLVSVEDGCGQRRCSACFVMKRKMLADPYGRSLYQVACCIFGDVMHLFMPIVKARCTWEPFCWRFSFIRRSQFVGDYGGKLSASILTRFILKRPAKKSPPNNLKGFLLHHKDFFSIPRFYAKFPFSALSVSRP